MKEWLAVPELTGLPGMPGTQQGIRYKAKTQSWKSRKRAKGKGREYHIDSLPAEAQAAIYLKAHKSESSVAGNPPTGGDGSRDTGRGVLPAAGSPSRPSPAFSYCRESLWAAFDRKHQASKALAERRLRAIDAALRLIEGGAKARDAWKTAARAAGMSRQTLQRLHKRCRQYERADWLPALADARGGNRKRAEFDPAAWEFFRADYLRPEQPSIAACYERLALAAGEHGWEIPSHRVVIDRVRRIPIYERVLMREGENALLRLYPPMQRSVADLHALEWINGDGYQHNVFVKWPDGTIGRPKTWFWQDVFSRRILAYRTDRTEHTDVIRQSVGDLIEQYGLPEHATIDNTRAAANKWMTGGLPHRYRFRAREDDPDGLFKTLGVQVHWTSVHQGKGHGQAKPVERAFGVGGLGEVVDKHPALAGAYTGKDTSSKPDNYGDRAVELEEFLQVLHQGVRLFNARKGRRTEACGGTLSFDEAFQQSYRQAAIRKATPEQRRLWMLSAEGIRVDRNGCIALDAGGAQGLGKNRYHCDALAELIGRKVVARFDPQKLHEGVHIYTLDNRYLGYAECVVTAGFGDTEAAREYNRKRRQVMRNTKETARLQQSMTADEVARLLPEGQDPDFEPSKIVRPQFGRAVGDGLHPDDDERELAAFSRAVRAATAARQDDF